MYSSLSEIDLNIKVNVCNHTLKIYHFHDLNNAHSLKPTSIDQPFERVIKISDTKI